MKVSATTLTGLLGLGETILNRLRPSAPLAALAAG